MSPTTVALMQKGHYQAPGFFGDQSESQSHSNFTQAISASQLAQGVSQVVRRISASSVSTPRNVVDNFYFTDREKEMIENKALGFASLGVTPYDLIEDFLYTLCTVDNIIDLTCIGRAVYIPELGEDRFIRNVDAILNIPDLYKVIYLANVMASVINMYAAKFNSVALADDPQGSSLGDTISAVQTAISLGSSLLSLAGGGGSMSTQFLEGSAGNRVGNFMSEVLTGQRIPMSKIAKNPMLQVPSYAGKAFFGESSSSLAAVDQTFARRIAVFPRESSGGGVSSFGFMNLGKFAGNLSLGSMMSNMLIGSFTQPSADTYVGAEIAQQTENVASILNVPTSSTLQMNRSDNAIPFMIAASAAIVGETKCPFESSVFQDSWKVAGSVSNDLLSANPDYLTALRSFT